MFRGKERRLISIVISVMKVNFLFVYDLRFIGGILINCYYLCDFDAVGCDLIVNREREGNNGRLGSRDFGESC